MAKIVIALGGNALGNDPVSQKKALKLPAKQIALLAHQGHTVVVGHGNGPQVGMIFNAFQDAKTSNPSTPYIQFAESGAMSQGYIGYHMQTAITQELRKLGDKRDCMYILTQTIVDKKDHAFKNPTKPVGPFFKSLEKAKNAYGEESDIIEDAGRGYRKVVPSPKPIGFVSENAIKSSTKEHNVVIVAGGGGIPTIINKSNNTYQGVDGVIDKDFALSKIAQIVGADYLIILTAISNVYINFNKPNQQALVNTNTKELKQYIKENQFAKGSMLPKIQASIEFLEFNKKGKVIITDLNNLKNIHFGNNQNCKNATTIRF